MTPPAMERAPSSQRKTYVLDSNVVLYDPRALYSFEEHEVVIPITVIEEVDRFKKDLNETGRNARHFSRHLDTLSAQARNGLSEGVDLPDRGSLRVDLCEGSVDWRWADARHAADNQILAVARDLHNRAEGPGRVILVTKDTNMRIKANALGILAEDYEHGKVSLEELYTGQDELSVDPASFDALYRQGEVLWNVTEHPVHQCIVVRNADRPTQTALARVTSDGTRLRMIRRIKEGVWGIYPRNKEQCFALDLLLDDEVRLVSLVGKAGTGKTLLAIAAGLQKVVDEKVYSRLLVSRPIFPLGKDVGFLPGDIGEKLNPWMKPVFDNVEFILDSRNGGRGKSRGHIELIEQGVLEIEPLTYIRGRSIPHQFLIIDEAQNLTPHEIKTIITRAGEGTKVVLTGDPYQIDNPYIDATSNGLVVVVERFRNEKVAGHITLHKGERSILAEAAANLL